MRSIYESELGEAFFIDVELDTQKGGRVFGWKVVGGKKQTVEGVGGWWLKKRSLKFSVKSGWGNNKEVLEANATKRSRRVSFDSF